MASIVAEDSTEPTFRRSRTNTNNHPTSPSPQTRCKPTISSLFLSTFSTPTTNPNQKKNFTSFRGLGCASSSQVSSPDAVIRSSADWQAKKVRKKKQRSSHKKKKNQEQQIIGVNGGNPSSVSVVPDVWCAPGIGLASSDATSDCVVVRRPVLGRGRTDGGDRFNHRERSCAARRAANIEHLTVLDSPPDIETSRFGSDAYGARHHRHFRHRSPGGLAEILLFQSGLMTEGRSDGYDQYRDWRLDVDSMSYEELLDLGDQIGYVSTGLKEEEIQRCLGKTKHAILDAISSRIASEVDWKCSICQEEYETGDEVGKLKCGHGYHITCIKQWLQQKNFCPVCKVAAVSQG